MSDADWLVGPNRSSSAQRRILAAAEQLFWQRGLHAVTVDAVARKAGCSRATLYRHVDGRRALIDAAVLAGATRITRHVETAAAAAPVELRSVVAVISAIEAIRRDKAVRDWVTHPAQGRGDDDLGRSAAIANICSELTGVTDPLAVEMLVRFVLALVLWPLPDAHQEHELVSRLISSLTER